MNNVTAAMALEQLKKLPDFMEKRATIHNKYNEGLKDLSWLDLPLPMEEDCKSSYYFYHIQTKNNKRDELARFLRERDIYTTYRYYPLHRVPFYNASGDFANADYAADNTLCLPMHQGLTNKEVEKVIETVIEFGKKYC